MPRVATTTNCRHCDGIARLDAVASAGGDGDAAAGAFADDDDDVAGDVAAAAGVNDCGDGGAAAGFETSDGFAGVAGVVADARTKTVLAAALEAAVMLSPPSSG